MEAAPVDGRRPAPRAAVPRAAVGAGGRKTAGTRQVAGSVSSSYAYMYSYFYVLFMDLNKYTKDLT